MRPVFAVACSKCQPTAIAPGIQRSVVIMMPYQDGPLYYLTCPSGHEERVLLGTPKHEILFQMGSYALLDENYWAAIAMFGSSLEEFWEFAHQCIYAYQKVTPLPLPRVNEPGNKARFENAWREVFKPQPPGTRQYPEPPVLTKDQYEIRNQVMHRGHIPTKEEAVDLGNAVLTRVAPATDALRWTLDGAVGEASHAIIADAKVRLHLDEPTASLGEATILHGNESMPHLGLADYMPHLRDMDEMFASIKAAQRR
jgi:hypothetical protein